MTEYYSGTVLPEADGDANAPATKGDVADVGCLGFVLVLWVFIFTVYMSVNAHTTAQRLCYIENRQHIGTGVCP